MIKQFLKNGLLLAAALLVSQQIAAQCNTAATPLQNVSCNGGADGSAYANASGGIAPYTYLWALGAATDTVYGMSAGSHSVTITDNVGCTATSDVTILEPTALSASTTPTHPTCNNGADGQIQAIASGGVPPYSYFWGPISQVTQVVTGLGAGVYTLTVTDANGCTFVTSETLSDPTAISISINSPTLMCNGDVGNICATPSGGTTPYIYNWDIASTSACLNGVGAGTYNLTVTDMNGCFETATVILTEPPVLDAMTLPGSTIQPSCGNWDGSLEATGTGGTAPYFYNWIDGQNTAIAVGLGGGIPYHCIVADANGCQANSDTVTLSTIPIFSVSASPDTIQPGASSQLGVNMPLPSAFVTWTPAVGLSCTNCLTPIATPNLTTEYILEGNDGAGCLLYDTLTVYVSQIDTLVVDTLVATNSVSTFTYTPVYGTPSYNPVSMQGSVSILGNDYTYTAAANSAADTFYIHDTDGWNHHYRFYIINVEGCVWAGDADDDGIANNFDLLQVGLSYGTTGPSRSNAGTDWDCEPMADWASTAGTPPVDLKHSDTDGNGIINDNDTLAISLNWNQTHLKNSNALGVPIFVDTSAVAPGQTIMADIVLGTAAFPASGAYGIAFTVNYPEEFIDTNSVLIDYNGGWLGTVGVDLLGIQKDFYFTGGKLEMALSRTDQNSIPTGSGAICQMQMTIKDDVLKSAEFRIDFEITNVRLIDAQGNELDVAPEATQILVTDEGTAIGKVQQEGLNIFPNPTHQRLNIQAESPIERLQLQNISGQILIQKTNISKNQEQLNLQDLAAGIYILTLQTEKGYHQRKVILMDK